MQEGTAEFTGRVYNTGAHTDTWVGHVWEVGEGSFSAGATAIWLVNVPGTNELPNRNSPPPAADAGESGGDVLARTRRLQLVVTVCVGVCSLG